MLHLVCIGGHEAKAAALAVSVRSRAGATLPAMGSKCRAACCIKIVVVAMAVCRRQTTARVGEAVQGAGGGDMGGVTVPRASLRVQIIRT